MDITDNKPLYNWETGFYDEKSLRYLKRKFLKRKVRTKLKNKYHLELETEDFIIENCINCNKNCYGCIKNCKNITELQDFLNINNGELYNSLWYE